VNKYTLGTILGTAALGFVKKHSGSSIKLRADKYKVLSFHYFASTKLMVWDGDAAEEGYYDEDDEWVHCVYPEEYWEKMYDIQNKQVNPELKKETFIEDHGLITFLQIGISMEPYDDGDPNWQRASLHLLFRVEPGSFYEDSDRRSIISAAIRRYSPSEFLFDSITHNKGILGNIFKKHGIHYQYTEESDGFDSFDRLGEITIVLIQKSGKWVPYEQPELAGPKLRKR